MDDSIGGPTPLGLPDPVEVAIDTESYGTKPRLF
jgi:hypothetical protein